MQWLQRTVYCGEHVALKEGEVVGLRNNIMNKEWAEMCRAEYNPYEVTNEPKKHGVTTTEEELTTGGRGDRIWGTRGSPYAE